MTMIQHMTLPRVLTVALCALGLGTHVSAQQELLNTTADSTTPFVPTGPEMALGLDKWLGGIHSPNQSPYFDLYFNQLTAENSTKWGSVEGTRDTMRWTEADAAYTYAKEHGYPFRFHVLVWGSQYPNWITTLSEADQLAEIEEWFAAVAERYPDIDYLEVVNEPLHAAPPFTAALGGAGTTGWDWVIKAFEMARQHFPDTPLVLNEYSVVNDPSQMNRYLQIIQLLKDRNLVDIVAEQGHSFTTVYGSDTMIAQLDRLAGTGLPIMITEFDISREDDAVQLSEYERIFPIFWDHPAVIGITLWGYRPGTWQTNAFLVNTDGSERPALVWLRDYVASSALPWNDYPVRYNWVNADDWLGWVYVGHAPWIWTESLGWAYQATESTSGGWFYISR